MPTDAIPVTVRTTVATGRGCALFLAAPQKTFMIYIDQTMGGLIGMIQNKVFAERPMTHDLIVEILQGLGATLERVVINHTNNGTFYARLILKMENELGIKLVEIDARPSDSIILAMRLDKPIFVAPSVLASVEDVSAMLEQLEKEKGKTA